MMVSDPYLNLELETLIASYESQLKFEQDSKIRADFLNSIDELLLKYVKDERLGLNLTSDNKRTRTGKHYKVYRFVRDKVRVDIVLIRAILAFEVEVDVYRNNKKMYTVGYTGGKEDILQGIERELVNSFLLENKPTISTW